MSNTNTVLELTRLRDARLRAGMSFRDVADKVGIAEDYYREIESGLTIEISMPLIEDICHTLDCSMVDMLDDLITARIMRQEAKLNGKR